MLKFLPDVCKIQYGYAFDSNKFSTVEGIPLVRIRDVVRGYSETYTFEICGKEYEVNNGDMLIGMDGEFNIAKWRGGKAWLNQRVCKLIPSEDVDANYLFYFMPTALKLIEEKTPYVTVKHLSAKELNKIEVPLPPMLEQQKIASVLEEISLIIEYRRNQLAELDNLVKARFVEMFGDLSETVALSNVADVTGGLTKNSKREKFDLKMPYLRVANVSFANIDVSEMLSIGLTADEMEKTLLKYGDLLFVEGNGSPDQIGRVAIWHNEVVPCVHQNHLIKARFRNSILPEYALYYFMTEQGREQIRSKAVSTSGLYTLSVSKVANFTIPLAPMNVQKEFAAFVEQVDKSKVAVQKALDEAQLLFDSLMQEYFG